MTSENQRYSSRSQLISSANILKATVLILILYYFSIYTISNEHKETFALNKTVTCKENCLIYQNSFLKSIWGYEMKCKASPTGRKYRVRKVLQLKRQWQKMFLTRDQHRVKANFFLEQMIFQMATLFQMHQFP